MTPLLAVFLVGVGAAFTLTSSSRRRGLQKNDAQSHQRFEARQRYLLDHLSGSDAALAVVERLKKSHAGTREGSLFADLDVQFREERAIVKVLLADVGGSTNSFKRLSIQIAGAILERAAGGQRGELALFRTLESLAIGVQGKRLMWRALDSPPSRLLPTGNRSFRDLEAMALDQWHRIEGCRRSLVADTLGS